ncbi:MAG TPA: class I SAM-dependent methyltransferase [Spirochaetota bacterium]|nr:class I SAM-dependent methyltransferase [Spirochaetota bacterium]HPV41443.1 class I SAM-dependent methyltransferase [Spirochaetota bacterium]
MSRHTCPSWFSFSLDNVLRRRFHDPAAILRGYIRPGNSVMDIGCGPGFFTIPMAQMAGENGTVIAVDLQKSMLDKMLSRAERLGLGGRIRAIQCSPDDIMAREKADFILTFWMVHEVRDADLFFKQVAAAMKQGSRYLLVEPKFHVSRKQYDRIKKTAETAGLKPLEEPAVPLSRSTLFSIQ